MNVFIETFLRLPVVHRVLSKEMLLITFVGRKSGKAYTTPVGYWRDGNTVWLMTKRYRKWWHNFEQPAPVTLWMEGRNHNGQAIAHTDVETLIPLITHRVEHSPQEAKGYGIALVNGKVDREAVRNLAPYMVVIEVRL
jgi:hypothetical protein